VGGGMHWKVGAKTVKTLKFEKIWEVHDPQLLWWREFRYRCPRAAPRILKWGATSCYGGAAHGPKDVVGYTV